MKIRKEIERFIPAARAIAGLLHPHAEVVLHDTETNTIAALYNSFSKRKAGDSSLLEEGETGNYPDYFEPYYKTNWDGRKLKSTTSVIKDEKGKIVGLLCINLDISQMEGMKRLLEEFTGGALASASDLFKDDWREKINTYVHEYAKENTTTLTLLTKEQKREVIFLLQKEGAFKAKRAAEYVADVLGISRATVYKYLSEKEGRHA
ncbi:helix-turn-helix transcriptional regulator [Estrella lausannensis]|uniref:YheO-like PAS domain-containing protein n=1 Tax=Estrella lausannensis TaxID=483423 RepID=A0A0H5DS70_9BACT|nr:PAS domain-containing protein [Estrella lausannensis]CRX39537.1 YheO-like PAS domain-containing protein [Estrella lausannensis]